MPYEPCPKRAWAWPAAVPCIGMAAPAPLATHGQADQGQANRDGAETETGQFEA